MTVSFNITSGSSDALPKKHFIPQHLRQKGKRELESEDGESHIPVYMPVLEFKHSLVNEFPFNSRIIDNGKLVWFSICAKEEIRMNSILFKDNELRAGRPWQISDLYKGRNTGEKCMATLVSFSPDLSFGVMSQHMKSNFIFKSVRAKICVSILKFIGDSRQTMKNFDTNTSAAGFKVYKNVLTLKYKKNLSHFVVCLSPKKKYLVLTIVNTQRQSDTFLFQIKYLEGRDKYELHQIQQLKIDYHVHSIRFNEFENTLLLLGSRCFYLIHPIDARSPSETKFYGCDPYIVYDTKLRTEFLFSQSKDNIYEVDIFQIKPVTTSSNQHLFGYEKIRNLQYDELRDVSGVKKVFYVHHYQNVTRLFLGFTNEVYVFNPFSCQCIYKLALDCEQETPFCYTLDANWSGKEVSIFCWDNFDFVSLKIYHVEEDERNISLKQIALLAVQANFSLDVLRQLSLPKFILSMLGDSSA